MSLNWPAGVIRKTPVTSSGSTNIGAARGIWTLSEAAYWQAKNKWPNPNIAAKQYVAVGSTTSPYITTYPWSDDTGFGVKYLNPTTLPTGACWGVAFHPSCKTIVFSSTSTPYIFAYKWSASGFGSQITTANLSDNVLDLAYSSDGRVLYLTTSSSTMVRAARTSEDGIGTYYSNPTGITAGAYGVSVSPANDAIVLGLSSSPWVAAYPWNSNTGFGTLYTAPAVNPFTSTIYKVAFSPSGTAVAVASGESPYIHAYRFSSSGWGSKYSNPTIPPSGTAGRGVSFSPDGRFVFVGTSTSPFIHAYQWNNDTGFGTKMADPVTMLDALPWDITFSATGNAVICSLTASAFIAAYAWSSSGFGAKYANPSSTPPSASYAIAVGVEP